MARLPFVGSRAFYRLCFFPVKSPDQPHFINPTDYHQRRMAHGRHLTFNAFK
jgi:hypothetical protein